MSANVVALHGDRTRALVQRPRRRAHVASIGAGEAAWTTVCGRFVPTEGATFWMRGTAEQHADEHTDEMCRDCGAIAVLVDWVVANALTDQAAQPAIDVEWERMRLEQDAAQVAALVMQGRSTDADALVEASGYRERLATWKAAR